MIGSLSYADAVKRTSMHNKASSSAEKPKIHPMKKDTLEEENSGEKSFNWKGLPDELIEMLRPNLEKQFDDVLEFYALRHSSSRAEKIKEKQKVDIHKLFVLKQLNDKKLLKPQIILTNKNIYHIWLHHIHDLLPQAKKIKIAHSPILDIQLIRKLSQNGHSIIRRGIALQERLPSDCIESFIYDDMPSVREANAQSHNLSPEHIKKILEHEIKRFNNSLHHKTHEIIPKINKNMSYDTDKSYSKSIFILENLIKNPVVPIDIIHDFLKDDKNKELIKKFSHNLIHQYMTEKGYKSSKILKKFIKDKHPHIKIVIRYLLDIYKKNKHSELDEIQNKYQIQ